MKQELIKELFKKFESAAYEKSGVEFWSARGLQVLFRYSDWRNFVKVIEKAKKACESVDISIQDHFIYFNAIVEMANGAKREIDDMALTRYACYLIAQNGDPSKSEIAFAQTYFAVQTRKQEIIEKRLLDVERVLAREKLSKSEKILSGIIYERGVDDKGFAIIRSKGDEALFGGYSTHEMKKKLDVPENRPLADFLPTLTIKAKDFATELTSHNVIENKLEGQQNIAQEHVDNNLAVRKILHERGVKPEMLPTADNVKILTKKIESEDKQIIKNIKKLKGKKQ